ncbi:MAG: preprotein translocase subunit YajC [Clostridiales bacterium]|nr:preprotein translocase subunit YajC [Clostridiales bacterium]
MLLSSSSGITMIVMYIVIFGAIIYFMMIRPQNKQKKETEELHASMQAGDSVLTTSGFYGVIIDIMDDTVIVEFGNNHNCRIPMTKNAIQAVEKPNLAKTAEEEE